MTDTSERAERLKIALYRQFQRRAPDLFRPYEESGEAFALAFSAIVDELGLSWEMWAAVYEFVDTPNADRDELMWGVHDALSTLLTAAGITEGT